MLSHDCNDITDVGLCLGLQIVRSKNNLKTSFLRCGCLKDVFCMLWMSQRRVLYVMNVSKTCFVCHECLRDILFFLTVKVPFFFFSNKPIIECYFIQVQLFTTW